MRSGWGANIFWSLVKENFGERLFELGVVGVPEIKDKLRPDPLIRQLLGGMSAFGKTFMTLVIYCPIRYSLTLATAGLYLRWPLIHFVGRRLI